MGTSSIRKAAIGGGLVAPPGADTDGGKHVALSASTLKGRLGRGRACVGPVALVKDAPDNCWHNARHSGAACMRGNQQMALLAKCRFANIVAKLLAVDRSIFPVPEQHS